MRSWRLLLTRPAEDGVCQAGELAQQRIFCSTMPLLSIEPFKENSGQRAAILALDEYQAVLVVSKAAAQLGLALLDHYWPQPPLHQCWFTPGAASAQLLKDCGLQVFWPSEGDTSEALLALPQLAQALAAPNPKALLLCGEGGRTQLADSLRAHGVAVDTLPLYRRVLPAYPAGELPRRIEREQLNAIAISSGQGLQHLLQLAADDWSWLRRLPLFVPSARVAEQARAASALEVIDCGAASSSALLAALHSHARKKDLHP